MYQSLPHGFRRIRSGRSVVVCRTWRGVVGPGGAAVPLKSRRGHGRGSIDDGEDIVLAHEQDLLVALDLELLTRVRGEQDAVADLDLERPALAVLRHPAVPNRDDLALLRLVLGRVGEHD